MEILLTGGVNLVFHRLPSQERRISEKNTSLNGHTLGGHFTGHIHPKPRCSVNAVVSQNLIRWLKKQKEEQKLPDRLNYTPSYSLKPLLYPALKLLHSK